MLLYSDFWNAGYAVIPEKEHMPLKGLQWSRIFKEKWRPDHDEVSAWDNLDNYDYGLVCGQPSGVVAIDFDLNDEGAIRNCLKFLGGKPPLKRGTKGLTAFYRYSGEPSQSFSKKGEMIVEVLSNGRKTTIPPSKIPVKKKSSNAYYEWVDCDGLPSSPSELPPLKKNYLDILQQNLNLEKDKLKVEKKYLVEDEYKETSIEEVAKAVNFIDPDDYYTWVYVGMALCSEFGDSAFSIWDDWSKKSEKYQASQSFTKWRSFHNPHSITIGTFFYLAGQSGYKKEKIDKSVIVSELDFESYEKKMLKKRSEEINKLETLPEFYEKAPGLIGKIARWIVETSIYEQPTLAVGAAISMIGFLMGKEFVTKEKMPVKTALYVIGIANTTTGKEAVKKCAHKILRELDEYDGSAGYLDKFEAALSSGTALQESMVENKGWNYMIWEECAFLFKEMMGQNASAFTRDIARIMLDVYANDFYKTRRMAKSNDNWKPTVIENPCVSLFGLTQKEPFFEAMNKQAVLSGQLNRMVFFQGAKYRPFSDDQDMFGGEVSFTVPPEIKQECIAIRERAKQAHYHGGIITPYKVEYDKDAKEYCLLMQKEYEKAYRESEKSEHSFHQLCGRYVEQVKKIALIASTGEIIRVSHLRWARTVVDYSNGILCAAVDDMMHINSFEQNLTEILNFVKDAGQIKHQTLVRRFKHIRLRDFNEMIEKLVDFGEIEVFFIDNGAKKKPKAYRYLLTRDHKEVI